MVPSDSAWQPVDAMRIGVETLAHDSAPMIERMAVGLENAVLNPHLHGCSVQIHGDPRRFYTALARATLVAMRQSTIAMIMSCADVPWSQQDVWRRSIDAALAED